MLKKMYSDHSSFGNVPFDSAWGKGCKIRWQKYVLTVKKMDYKVKCTHILTKCTHIIF